MAKCKALTGSALKGLSLWPTQSPEHSRDLLGTCLSNRLSSNWLSHSGGLPIMQLRLQWNLNFSAHVLTGEINYLIICFPFLD